MPTDPRQTSPQAIDALIADACGELSPAETDHLRRMVAAAPHLQPESARIHRVVDVLRQGGLVSPPEFLIARARSLCPIPTAAAAGADLLSRLTAVIARLIFDSRAAHALQGFRSASIGEQSYHLTFRSPDGDVDLQVQPAPPGGTVRILGQIESPRPARHVFLRQQQHAVCEAPVDRFGMFTLEVSPGTYSMDIILEHGIIRIPSVDLA